MKIRNIFSETKNSTGKAVQLCDRSVTFLAKKGCIALEGTKYVRDFVLCSFVETTESLVLISGSVV